MRRYRKLSLLLNHIAENSPKTGREVADAMGIPYSTLMNQLNENIPNAVFKADDLLAFMRAYESVEPLEYLAREMGYRIEPLTSTPDGRNMEHECLQAHAAVNELCKAVEAGRTYTETQPLCEKAVEEIEEIWTRQRAEQSAREDKK